MQKIIVHYKSSHSYELKYETPQAAGIDVKASLQGPVVIEPGERALIPTGIRLEIPAGYEAQMRPRSGLAIKNGITLLNSPGTIDADYRGEVKVILINLGQEAYRVEPGARVAQMVFAPVVQAQLIYRHELGETERGAGGFGSTGV